MTINPVRHLSIFSPEKFGQRRIDIIGVGASGSHVALLVAKLGVKNLHIWDFDHVEDHNLANQMYGPDDVGKPKVDACADLIKYQTGLVVTKHNQKLEAGHKDLGEIVFLLVDSMKARTEIAEKCINMNFKTKLMIETRMGEETGMIYTVDMMNGMDYKSWKTTLYADEEAAPSACGAATTIGSTAMMVASYATWQMLNWIRNDKIETNEIIFSTRPPMIDAHSFFEKQKEEKAAAA
jgi:molybdopterin/thiamine biosynthesis adenylyltransferase